MSQAKALAKKIDKQTKIITKAEQTRGRLRDKLAEVHFRLDVGAPLRLAKPLLYCVSLGKLSPPPAGIG